MSQLMRKRKVDWSAATPAQIDRSLRLWRIRLIVAAVQYAIVVGIAFWVGSAVVGAITILVGLVGLAWAWRYVTSMHSAKAPRST
jgi:hypothetical protein